MCEKCLIGMSFCVFAPVAERQTPKDTNTDRCSFNRSDSSSDSIDSDDGYDSDDFLPEPLSRAVIGWTKWPENYTLAQPPSGKAPPSPPLSPKSKPAFMVQEFNPDLSKLALSAPEDQISADITPVPFESCPETRREDKSTASEKREPYSWLPAALAGLTKRIDATKRFLSKYNQQKKLKATARANLKKAKQIEKQANEDRKSEDILRKGLRDHEQEDEACISFLP
ncbi:hypothetical protein BT63DRAFT_464433 [Microthyrium microscopicum]|uniref:Uncharacterized protein n=1 Tax=Microthyrium microscopicum TaxID=703497 RepID=A0A6A6TYI3_9PEZI|nr:hypothetical protein BT63DRAFT_464433 [Microthyrium microscopicum]